MPKRLAEAASTRALFRLDEDGVVHGAEHSLVVHKLSEQIHSVLTGQFCKFYLVLCEKS